MVEQQKNLHFIGLRDRLPDNEQTTEKLLPKPAFIAEIRTNSSVMADVCVVCGKKVRTADKGVCCDGKCNRWFHASCKNITAARYKALAEDTKQEWFCDRDDCFAPPNLKDLTENVNILKEKNQ